MAIWSFMMPPTAIGMTGIQFSLPDLAASIVPPVDWKPKDMS